MGTYRPIEPMEYLNSGDHLLPPGGFFSGRLVQQCAGEQQQEGGSHASTCLLAVAETLDSLSACSKLGVLNSPPQWVEVAIS